MPAIKKTQLRLAVSQIGKNDSPENMCGRSWTSSSSITKNLLCRHQLLQVAPADYGDVVVAQGLLKFRAGDRVEVGLTPG